MDTNSYPRAETNLSNRPLFTQVPRVSFWIFTSRRTGYLFPLGHGRCWPELFTWLSSSTSRALSATHSGILFFLSPIWLHRTHHFACEMCRALQLPTASCPLTFNLCIMTPTNTLMCMCFETASTGKNSSHELGTGCSWQRAVLQHSSQFRCSAAV